MRKVRIPVATQSHTWASEVEDQLWVPHLTKSQLLTGSVDVRSGNS